jgi:Zn-dependent metalloprotease
MAQQKNGLRVVNGDAIVHLDSEGTVRSVNGSVRDRDLPSKASFAAEDASQLAVKTAEDPSTAVRSELAYLVSNRDGELYLTWEVTLVAAGGDLTHEFVYVDALTGSIVERHPQLFMLISGLARATSTEPAPCIGAA